MHKQINYDYARAKWPHRKISNNLGSWIVIFVVFAIGLGAMLGCAVRAEPVEPCSITGAAYDNLMSEDMAAYTVLYGHGQEYEESDMQ